MSAFGRRLSLLVISVALTGSIPALTGVSARGEDLDRGKSGAQLFAASCVVCHQSPRGLAKDRFSSTLSSFLQQHYTSSRESAQVRRRRSAHGASCRRQIARSGRECIGATSEYVGAPWANIFAPSLRPPAPIPGH